MQMASLSLTDDELNVARNAIKSQLDQGVYVLDWDGPEIRRMGVKQHGKQFSLVLSPFDDTQRIITIGNTTKEIFDQLDADCV